MTRRAPTTAPSAKAMTTAALVALLSLAGCSALGLPSTPGRSTPSSTTTQPATTPAARAAQSDLTAKLGTKPVEHRAGGAMVVATSGTPVPDGLVAASEKAAAAVRSLDSHASRNPLLVVIPRDAAEYKAFSGNEPDNQLASTITRGGVLPYVVMSPWTIKHPNSVTARETLAHEAFHALTLENLATDRPLWLLEGWAEYVGQKAVPQAPHKRDDIHPHVPSDEELRGKNASDAYYVAFTFARYLRDTYGNEKVMAFYTDAVATRDSMETLATKHFGKGVTQLESGYVAWYPTFR